MKLRRKVDPGKFQDSIGLNFNTVSYGRGPNNAAEAERKPQPASASNPLRPPKQEGLVNLNPRGFGFVNSSEGLGYYLSAALARAVLPGDLITFVPAHSELDSREVRTITWVERKASHALCQLLKIGGAWHLIPDESFSLGLSFIDSELYAAELFDEDVVAVAISAYSGPPSVQPLEARFTHRLGARTDVGFDTLYARWQFGFEQDFPVEVVSRALDLARQPLDFSGLIDLRDLPFVTIDDESTEDVDDAVFARELGQGYEVFIAIADVSHFVATGSELDNWAAKRCTSVYLPSLVLPMLPRLLSIGQGALVAHVERRAVVLRLLLSKQGEVLESDFSRAAIVSAGKLSYAGVTSFISGGSQRYKAEIEASLTTLSRLGELLSKARAEAGRLDFEEPEPTLKTVNGRSEIVWESRTIAHKLVEELMLLANKQAATALMTRYGGALLRHQPAPVLADWHQLRQWAGLSPGVAQSTGLLSQVPSMQALAAWVKAQPDEERVQLAALRTRSIMQPAKYIWHDSRSGPCGHFSLNFDWYTHFTSPIRRYADLLVHRLLLAPPGYEVTLECRSTLAELAQQCSERARAARMAERRVWDKLKLGAFIAEATPEKATSARVLRSTTKGVRVVLKQWQCAAWVLAKSLKTEGFIFNSGYWSCGPLTLVDGTSLLVSSPEVSLSRPAYPELIVKVVLPKNKPKN